MKILNWVKKINILKCEICNEEIRKIRSAKNAYEIFIVDKEPVSIINYEGKEIYGYRLHSERCRKKK